MAHLSPNPKQRFVDANGNPLSSGKLYSYQAGTTTPLATYVDQTEVTPNANPVILDSNGEADVWLGSAAYKLVLKDSSDVVQWTVDNISILNAQSVTTSKIADSAVTTAKIADLGVTTAKLAAASVTRAKIASLGQQVSSASGDFTTTNSSLTDVTNLSVSITTTGRPVFVGLIWDTAQTVSGVLAAEEDGVTGQASEATSFKIVRGSTDVCFVSIQGAITVNNFRYSKIPLGSLWTIDPVAAGTYTYKVQANAGTNSLARVRHAKLIAYEIG